MASKQFVLGVNKEKGKQENCKTKQRKYVTKLEADSNTQTS